MRSPVVALVLAVIAPGCLGESPAEPAEPGPTGAWSESLPAFDLAVSFAAGSQNAVMPASAAIPEGVPGGSLDVPVNVTRLLIEARWTCTSPTCTFVMEVLDPDNAVRGAVAGDGMTLLVVESPATGSWDVGFRPDGPSTGMAGELRATVFFGGGIPEGFSAF